MTNEESTEIVSFLTPGVGGLVSGFGQFIRSKQPSTQSVFVHVFIDFISGFYIVGSLVLTCNLCGKRYIKYNKYLQNRDKLSFLYL